MVGVAQLVELRIVIPAVVGSNPIVHPISLLVKLTRETFLSGNAGVVELVDTLDLGSSASRRESSSLSFRTICLKLYVQHIIQNICLSSFKIGEWRSLVAHLVWVQGVVGSNPISPTILNPCYIKNHIILILC